MGEGEPPPVLPGGAVPPALLPARGPAAARARPSVGPRAPQRSPGEVLVTLAEVQDFIVSEPGQRPPMWATGGLWEQQPRLRLSLCKPRRLQSPPGGLTGEISAAPRAGGGWYPVPPRDSVALGRCAGSVLGGWG